MSLYANKIKVNGVRCGMITRGGQNGEYTLVFERDFAAPEQIEALQWDALKVEYADDYTGLRLPEGYGFELAGIEYSYNTRSYKASIRTGAQYLGDVTEYQEQIETLNAAVSELNGQKAQLETQAESLAEENAVQAEKLIQLESQAEKLAQNEAVLNILLGGATV